MDQQPEQPTPGTEAARNGDTLDGSAIISHSEGLMEASAEFDHQMEQMQRWKQQLAGQMDLLRKDGLKLLDRQKKLAEERDQVATLKKDLETQLAAVQQQQAELLQRIKAAEAGTIEAAQLEAQRAQVRDDTRTAEGMIEDIGRRQNGLIEQEKALAQKAAEIEAREKAAVALEQRLLVSEVHLRETTEQLEVQRRELLASTQKIEARGQKVEQLEQELAEQMLIIAAQTKRIAERRAASGEAESADEHKIQALTRERDTQEARIRHLVTEINETKAQVATLEAESLTLSQQARRADELAGEKRAAEQRAAALTAELEKANAETMTLREKLNTPQAPLQNPDTEALTQRFSQLEDQLAKTSAQLKETLDFADLQAAETALIKSAHEAETRDFQSKIETLAAEKSRLAGETETLRAAKPADASAAETHPPSPAKQGTQRGVLVRQARTLRNKRRQSHELMSTLETTRAELGKQLQQVRVRRDNLEQVKRLLVKQEMVMARKLADHNALKTVAAVGIFLIMILGSTFLGVYRFVNPEFRGEALVQLTPPAQVAPDKVDAWLQAQAAALRADPNVLQIAWSALRQDGYAMHDTKEGWSLSLANDLTTTVDSSTKAIALRIKGPYAEGVAQSSNALAAAFADVAKGPPPGTPAISGTPKPSVDLPFAASSIVIGKATTPQTPVQDQRLMLALGVSGGLMLVALLAVFIVRKLISRQLKEIDQMADAKDLEDLHDDMASVDNATPA